jgi:MSHA pilin protein MshA
MKNRLNSEKGFTLIELVMVIVILGILAATAIPKFVDLKEDARSSVISGVTGALQGAITMKHAQYLIGGTDYTATTLATGIDQQGITVTGTATGMTSTFEGATTTWTYVRTSGSNETQALACNANC